MLSGFSELVVDALMSVEMLMHLSMFKGLTTSCQHTVQWNITFNRSSIRSPVVCYARFSFVDDIGSNEYRKRQIKILFALRWSDACWTKECLSS